MTILISLLFLTAMLMSAYAVVATVTNAWPRIKQIISERGKITVEKRVIVIGEFRKAARPAAKIIAFAPRRVSTPSISDYGQLKQAA